jgi:hypothetical protein
MALFFCASEGDGEEWILVGIDFLYWYLHNDMQFHWIAPITLILFVVGRKT